MTSLLCRTGCTPIGAAFHCIRLGIPVLHLSPQLHSLSQLHTHSIACNLRVWHSQDRVLKTDCKTFRAAHAASVAEPVADTRPKVVFLGTPEVAADVLFKLISASRRVPQPNFQIAAVVTQPAKTFAARAAKPLPVEKLAADWLSREQILCPQSASDEDFLETLRALKPDVCLTAAYGNILPAKFLEIPKYGTVNIHPSLLPKYRGAAPVQRALQDGVTETGVSLLYTVKAMDAGPVIAQESVQIDEGIQGDALLYHLFAIGTRLFLDNLDSILSGEAQKLAQPQDSSQVSHAAKLRKSEGKLFWDMSATDLHNQVRAFTPWPGSNAVFLLESPDVEAPSDDEELEALQLKAKAHFHTTHGQSDLIRLKILKTVVGKAEDWRGEHPTDVTVTKDALHVKCDDGSVLSILQVQKAGKKPMLIQAFCNGDLQNRLLHRPVFQQ